MSWRYGVLKSAVMENYQVVEFYLNDKGEIEGYSEPIFGEDSFDDITTTLENMLSDCKAYPIYDEEKMRPIEEILRETPATKEDIYDILQRLISVLQTVMGMADEFATRLKVLEKKLGIEPDNRDKSP